MYGESKNAPSYDISVACLSLSYRQRKQKILVLLSTETTLNFTRCKVLMI